MQIKFTALAVLLLATALSGCGGGGGGGGEGGSSSVPASPNPSRLHHLRPGLYHLQQLHFAGVEP